MVELVDTQGLGPCGILLCGFESLRPHHDMFFLFVFGKKDMQVTELLKEGLKREYEVVVSFSDIRARFDARLDSLRSTARLKGFRPGKVPVRHLRNLYGRHVMGEVLGKAVDESSSEALSSRRIVPAYKPDIDFSNESVKGNEEEVSSLLVERLLSDEIDIKYVMRFEVLPEIKTPDMTGLSLEKPVCSVSDSDIESNLDILAMNLREFSSRGEGDVAQHGDRLIISFEGKIDGEIFEGGKGDRVSLDIGSGKFIPGFEEQLIGVRKGEDRIVRVVFPDEYPTPVLAGKPAVFDVRIEDITYPSELVYDDVFAKRCGARDMGHLRDLLRTRLESENAERSYEHLKRSILDILDSGHDFSLPSRLVEQEFSQIWESMLREMSHRGGSFSDGDVDEEALRADYHDIAERRVRLGLLVAHIGKQHEISVSDEEVQNILMREMNRFPGHEKEMFEFYRNNPSELIRLRGPVFERKVIEYIISQAKITEKSVSREELFSDFENEESSVARKKSKTSKRSSAKKGSAGKKGVSTKTSSVSKKVSSNQTSSSSAKKTPSPPKGSVKGSVKGSSKGSTKGSASKKA